MTQTLDTETQSGSSSPNPTEMVQNAVSQIPGQIADQLSGQVNQKAHDAGDQVSTMAQALRTTSTDLEEQGQQMAAQAINMVADRADQFAQYLRNTEFSEVMGDVEHVIGDQPWIAVGGGLVLGFLGARLLKASSTNRYQQRSGIPNSTYSTYQNQMQPQTTNSTGTNRNGSTSGL